MVASLYLPVIILNVSGLFLVKKIFCETGLTLIIQKQIKGKKQNKARCYVAKWGKIHTCFLLDLVYF